MAVMMTSAISHKEQSFTSRACSEQTQLSGRFPSLSFMSCFFTPVFLPHTVCMFLCLLYLSPDASALLFGHLPCPCPSFQVPPIIDCMTDVLQGATSTSTASSASLSLNATVSGLGPAFKLTLELCNNGSQPILGAALVSPHIVHGRHTMHPCDSAQQPLLW